MSLSLNQLESELAATPLTSPYGWPLTVAILSDVFRLAGRAPPPALAFGPGEAPNGDRLGVLAHLLATTALRDESVRALAATQVTDLGERLASFRAAIEPLTAEMVRANAFRREELVRRWLEVVGGEITGETAQQARDRVDQLDYRKTLAEFSKAEDARKAEAERRAKLLREAQERETAARGWRE